MCLRYVLDYFVKIYLLVILKRLPVCLPLRNQFLAVLTKKFDFKTNNPRLPKLEVNEKYRYIAF